ncbi:Mitochondrial presequence protease [Neolecta irregularis DAH-3]|uniref:Presequence protease, mitochondrial n=1 Tax=Neolecta irregularis (strain DAH-3) TaxID=1198029 RepID=A0A1U7LQG6_NEOID|nr:Mitochondrial presequence protease [Neolecta irregularis DAH-3]|eukprot:OLL24897.1 Mitochondrial presequence protease [Neolecta irregularis DAH-3]
MPVFPLRRLTSTATRFRSLPSVGDSLHGYTVARTKHIPELQLDAIHLRHDQTGLEHLHIARDDPNNVFAIGFETPPYDHTGLPHILEHTTLCGSTKYPVRDPFFKMLNRSLANFMNAMTASDHTFYPFATTNAVDYANLQDVYLDSVFFPNLKQLDFRQEGWRLEHENPRDTSTPLVFKGVVYNEMKGQQSDSSYLFYVDFQKNMYRNTIYENDSGGDPKYITTLTWKNLVDFHKRYYHPSNSKVLTYGNFEIEDHLQAANLKIKNFSQIDPIPAQKEVKRFDGPRAVESIFPVDPMSDPKKQLKISLSFLANDTTDTFKTFSLKILSHLLTDGHSSPMYQALIDTGLGSDWSPNTGYDSSTKTAVFSIGLQGVQEGNETAVHEKIFEVLREVREKGFEVKKIEGVLHQLELGLKHKTAHFGMGIMYSILPGWFNQVDPFSILSWNETLDSFKREVAKGGYFEGLIEEYFLQNQSQLIFTMRPSSSLTDAIVQEEKERLSKQIGSLNSEDLTAIGKQGVELLEQQEAQEIVDCLPTLNVTDIQKFKEKTKLEFGKIEDIDVQWRVTGTNGLTYFRAVNTLKNIPDDLKIYLPLFAECITNLGTKERSMGELEGEIRLKTGGLRVGTLVATNHSNLDQIEEGLTISGHCLDHNVHHMFNLLQILLFQTNFDNVEKLQSLIRGNASDAVNNIAASGHKFARAFASSCLTPGARATEVQGGMTQMKFMTQLAGMHDLSETIAKLKEISRIVFQKSSVRTAITCADESIKSNSAELSKFLKSFPNQIASLSTTLSSAPLAVPSQNAFFPFPFSVNYTALCLRGVPYTHHLGPSLQILSNLLTHRHLHREIREKGGAYGGGASYSGQGGILGFYSYRDPDARNSLTIMKESGKWAIHKDWTKRELEESKLSVFQKIDAPISVNQEGMIQFVDGITYDMRQRHDS